MLCSSPEAPLFTGMLCVYGLRPRARTHLRKGFVPYSSGWWDGFQILKASKQSRQYALLFGRRVYRCADLAGCVLVLVRVDRCSPWPESSSLSGGAPRFWPSLEGLGLSLAPEAPLFSGMLTGPGAFLEQSGVSGLRPCTRIHLKRPCATLI